MSIVVFESKNISLELGPLHNGTIDLKVTSDDTEVKANLCLNNSYENYYSFFKDIEENWGQPSKKWLTPKRDGKFEVNFWKPDTAQLVIEVVKQEHPKSGIDFFAEIPLSLKQVQGAAKHIKTQINEANSGVVKIGYGQSILELGPIQDEYLDLKLKAKGLTVELAPFIYYDSEGLYNYFNDLVMNWKGWDNFKEWRSIEGDFLLAARSRPTGHIELEVTLINNTGDCDGWELSCDMLIEPSQLQQVTRDIRELIDTAKI